MEWKANLPYGLGTDFVGSFSALPLCFFYATQVLTYFRGVHTFDLSPLFILPCLSILFPLFKSSKLICHQQNCTYINNTTKAVNSSCQNDLASLFLLKLFLKCVILQAMIL